MNKSILIFSLLVSTWISNVVFQTQASAAPSVSKPALEKATQRKEEISRKVSVLASVAFGARVHEVKGDSGEAMVRELAATDGGKDDEDFKVGLTSKDFDFGGMTSWGTTDLASAQDLFASGDGSDLDAKDEKLRATLGADILRELKRMGGVSFGFTSGSSSYCGMSFMGLLIVDEENEIIYEIALTDSGPC